MNLKFLTTVLSVFILFNASFASTPDDRDMGGSQKRRLISALGDDENTSNKKRKIETQTEDLHAVTNILHLPNDVFFKILGLVSPNHYMSVNGTLFTVATGYKKERSLCIGYDKTPDYPNAAFSSCSSGIYKSEKYLQDKTPETVSSFSWNILLKAVCKLPRNFTPHLQDTNVEVFEFLDQDVKEDMQALVKVLPKAKKLIILELHESELGDLLPMLAQDPEEKTNLKSITLDDSTYEPSELTSFLQSLSNKNDQVEKTSLGNTSLYYEDLKLLKGTRVHTLCLDGDADADEAVEILEILKNLVDSNVRHLSVNDVQDMFDDLNLKDFVEAIHNAKLEYLALRNTKIGDAEEERRDLCWDFVNELLKQGTPLKVLDLACNDFTDKMKGKIETLTSPTSLHVDFGEPEGQSQEMIDTESDSQLQVDGTLEDQLSSSTSEFLEENPDDWF